MTFKNGEVVRLKNRIAIVTGGAGGIGEAIALMFAQHGAGVIVADTITTIGDAMRKAMNL